MTEQNFVKDDIVYDYAGYTYKFVGYYETQYILKKLLISQDSPNEPPAAIEGDTVIVSTPISKKSPVDELLGKIVHQQRKLAETNKKVEEAEKKLEELNKEIAEAKNSSLEDYLVKMLMRKDIGEMCARRFVRYLLKEDNIGYIVNNTGRMGGGLYGFTVHRDSRTVVPIAYDARNMVYVPIEERYKVFDTEEEAQDYVINRITTEGHAYFSRWTTNIILQTDNYFTERNVERPAEWLRLLKNIIYEEGRCVEREEKKVNESLENCRKIRETLASKREELEIHD